MINLGVILGETNSRPTYTVGNKVCSHLAAQIST